MRILVIDDSIDLSSLIVRTLTAENFTTEAALDPGSAAARLRRHDYDLIVCDLQFSDDPKDRGGLELLERLRSGDLGQKNIFTPVIFLTGHGGPDFEEKLLNAGADDFLEKPFLPRRLLARIAAIRRRARPMTKTNLQNGPIFLDRRMSKVFLGSRQLSIFSKEFQLLEVLLENLGLVVPRTRIASALWPSAEYIADNTIEVHISRLRQALGDARDLLRTVRGRGYQMLQAGESEATAPVPAR